MIYILVEFVRFLLPITIYFVHSEPNTCIFYVIVGGGINREIVVVSTHTVRTLSKGI